MKKTKVTVYGVSFEVPTNKWNMLSWERQAQIVERILSAYRVGYPTYKTNEGFEVTINGTRTKTPNRAD